jgi:hypothetical protein
MNFKIHNIKGAQTMTNSSTKFKKGAKLLQFKLPKYVKYFRNVNNLPQRLKLSQPIKIYPQTYLHPKIFQNKTLLTFKTSKVH